MIGMLGYLAQLAFFTGEDPTPQGSEHPNLVPYGSFPAKDGSIIVACLTNSFWERICQAFQRPQWLRDPRFATIEKRRDNRGAVNEMIRELTREKTVTELVDLFTQYNVPHAPILGIRDALAQPQAVAREMVVETDHAILGKIPIVNRPIKFPGDPQPVPQAPPVLGQHTDEILRDILGLTAEKIAQLRAAKVVA
jgi:crotonobetainyl-CoA:carnitine CoA-transferase CaiB-like acyl-CoA transferase